MRPPFRRLGKSTFQLILVFGLTILLKVKQGLLIVDHHDAFHVMVCQHSGPDLIPVGLHGALGPREIVIDHQKKDRYDPIKPIGIEFGPLRTTWHPEWTAGITFLFRIVLFIVF